MTAGGPRGIFVGAVRVLLPLGPEGTRRRSMVKMVNPQEEYRSRRDGWRSRREIFQRQFIRIGNWRLFVGIAAAVMAFFAIGRGSVGLWWLLAPLSIFIAL